jgi:F-type H+-transporting ATPase subunit delta
MTGGIVARRYAKALFALAGEADGPEGCAERDRAADGLAFLVACLDASPDLETAFRNPVFTPEEKRGVIAALAEKGGLDETVRDFACLLADTGRLGFLRAVSGAFRTMLDEAKGILRGEFVSAVPLDEKKQGEILAALEKKAGRPLALEFTVDPGILGGMRLHVGHTVRDASLKTQLSLLTGAIKRGEQDHADQS